MRNIVKSFLFIFGMSAADSALSVSQVKEADAPDDKPFSLSVSTSLSQTPVRASSAEYTRFYAVGADLSWRLWKTDSLLLKDPSVSVGLSYSDDPEFEDESSNMGNTSLSFSGTRLELAEGLNLGLGLTAVLPTNEDDRDYISYQGSLLLTPTLGYELANGLRIDLSSTINRSFYTYETTKGGSYNPRASWSPGIAVSYQYEQISASAGVSNSRVLLTDGSRLDDTYRASVSLGWAPSEALGLGLFWQQTDRTFGYNRVRPNIDFKYADKTLLTVSATYTL